MVKFFFRHYSFFTAKFWRSPSNSTSKSSKKIASSEMVDDALHIQDIYRDDDYETRLWRVCDFINLDATVDLDEDLDAREDAAPPPASPPGDGASQQSTSSPASQYGAPHGDEALTGNFILLSSADRLSMHRDNEGELMNQVLQTIEAWETGKHQEDHMCLLAFDGLLSRLQACGYDPSEKGAAFVEVRGATGAVAVSVKTPNNVRKIPPASPCSKPDILTSLALVAPPPLVLQPEG